MKPLITSDLHTDINQTTDFGFMHDDKTEKDVIIIAGDISGSLKTHKQYLNKLRDIVDCPVVVIAGNHLGYDFYREGCVEWNLLDRSILLLRADYKDKIHFLHDEYIEIGDYVIFGGPMYTNFKLYRNPRYSMNAAMKYMNDFSYVHIYDDSTATIRAVRPTDYEKWFNRFKRKLKKCLKETTKDVIVVTHFAPSVKSISEKYNGIYKELNPSYASNMERFIKANPRIKLWVHGHMHDSFDYMIGQCRVVCEPYGYVRDAVYPPIRYKGKLIELL